MLPMADINLENACIFFACFIAVWLVGHMSFYLANKKPSGITPPPYETEEDRAKYEEIKKFADAYAAKQHSDVYKYHRARETEPPFQDHPYLKNTSYNRQNKSSDFDFMPIIMGAAAGYVAGSASHHCHDTSSSSSDSSSSGGE